MRIYQADVGLDLILKYAKLFPERKINVLRAFGNLDKDERGICITHRGKINSVILDSGTYTLNFAKNPGINISIDTYESYLLAFGQDYDFYFNFDSDFSKDGFTINNGHQRRLEGAGLKPVPVIHDIYGREVEYYIDRGHEIVAVGVSERAIDPLYMLTDRLYKAGVKVHLFGTSKYEYLTKLPIWSCDSTTWTKAGAYGSILYWNPHKRDINKTDQIYLEKYMHTDGKSRIHFSTYAFRGDLESYLAETLGITYQDFYGSDGQFFIRLVNLDFFVRMEERLNAKGI